MTPAAIWFLVAFGSNYISGFQYIGPMTRDRCETAMIAIGDTKIECRHATTWTTCPVFDKPGSGYACPFFNDAPPSVSYPSGMTPSNQPLRTQP